jgi:hypothetical protein
VGVAHRSKLPFDARFYVKYDDFTRSRPRLALSNKKQSFFDRFMHPTYLFDAFLPCFTCGFHAQSRQLRRFRHRIGQLPFTPGDRRPDVRVSGSHITYSMSKFQYSTSIPKGSLQTRIPIQDTYFGHFDPPGGVTSGHTRWPVTWRMSFS